MQPFLVDKDQSYTYNQLLADVNSSNSYCEAYQSDSLYSYYVNFIVALSNNENLVLIDAEMNNSEIATTGIMDVNKMHVIQNATFVNIAELTEAVLTSKSRITIFTSGTTGQPKQVVHSINTLCRTVRKDERYQNQTWAFAYNPTHMAGLQVFFQVFANNSTLINVFGESRKSVISAIKDYNITHISATPTFYRLLLPVTESFDNVQRITFGGEKSDNRLHDQIKKMFPNAKLNNVYASTEAGSMFAAKGEYFQVPERIRASVKIEDNELLIHRSLLGTSESFTFQGDFYSTGDLVEWIDASAGLFKFKSRKNELINVGGNKVNPSEIEEILCTIDGVKQARVYGKPNAILGNILCAELLFLTTPTITEPQIRILLGSQLQDYKIPRKIKFVDNLELTRTGKIKRL